MIDAQLRQVLRDEAEIIFARVAPVKKLQVVKALQANGEIVTVTGGRDRCARAQERGYGRGDGRNGHRSCQESQ